MSRLVRCLRSEDIPQWPWHDVLVAVVVAVGDVVVIVFSRGSFSPPRGGGNSCTVAVVVAAVVVVVVLLEKAPVAESVLQTQLLGRSRGFPGRTPDLPPLRPDGPGAVPTTPWAGEGPSADPGNSRGPSSVHEVELRQWSKRLLRGSRDFLNARGFPLIASVR